MMLVCVWLALGRSWFWLGFPDLGGESSVISSTNTILNLSTNYLIKRVFQQSKKSEFYLINFIILNASQIVLVLDFTRR